MSWTRKVVAVALALSLAECSFTIQGPRSGAPASEPPECTRSASGRKTLDVIGGLFFLYLAGASLAREEACPILYGSCRTRSLGERIGGAVVAVLPAALHLTALFVGARRTDRCDAAHKRHQLWLLDPRLDAKSCQLLEEDWREETDRKLKAALRQQIDRGCPSTVPRPSALEKLCEPHLSRWRSQRDVRRKTEIYDKMPSECRALITKPAARPTP